MQIFEAINLVSLKKWNWWPIDFCGEFFFYLLITNNKNGMFNKNMSKDGATLTDKNETLSSESDTFGVTVSFQTT